MKLRILLPVFTFVAAWIGALASDIGNSNWYIALEKPFFNPPAYIFGIVWPVLYLLMATVSFFNAKIIYKTYIIQLVLNSLWGWFFFVFENPILSLIDIGILIILNIYLLGTLLKYKNWLSFSLYLPYVLWISFALVLNLAIVILN